MAVGNTAGLTTASVNGAFASVASNLRSQYDYWKRIYTQLNANMSTGAQMTGVGISTAGDQAQLTALIGDLNRLIQVFEGTNPGSFVDMRNDCAVVMGVQ